MHAHDVMYEIGHAFNNYAESDGNGFDLDHDVNAHTGTLTVTSPDGAQHRFRLTVTELDN